MKRRTSNSRSKARSDNHTEASLPIVMEALASELRRELLVLIGNKPTIVSQLADQLKTEISQISHNLRRLKDAGLVTVTKKSNFRIYELAPCVKINRRAGWLKLTIQAMDEQCIELRMKAPQTKVRRGRRA